MRIQRLLIAGLVGLVALLLIGPGGNRVTAAEPRVTTASVMVPAAAFVPSAGSFDYLNNGWAASAAHRGAFVAPLSFPVPEVSVRKLTIYAHDQVNTGQFPESAPTLPAPLPRPAAR
jgi:hypothetical protein